MKVFKFGGASVKDANSVCKVSEIIEKYKEDKIIVISAMGKMTNAFEKLVNLYFNKQNFSNKLNEIKRFHYLIIKELFEKTSKVYLKIDKIFKHLEIFLEKEVSLDYAYEYDQIVSTGEFLSTTIVSSYLNEKKYINEWIDICSILKTDNCFREANVNWELSEKIMKKTFPFKNTKCYVTQGFLGGTKSNLKTTLGREGSDFTAALIANFLDAEKVIFWKDVDGVHNADPKKWKKSQKLEEIYYKEAVELSYFGAKIIHPKTIKPLKNKNIPLEVKSFLSPEKKGTIINSIFQKKMPPIFIFKEKQVLISIQPLDFSFIGEKNLSQIFALLAKYNIKVNLMQNSAVSFSICLDFDEEKINPFRNELQENFKVSWNTNLELITIRHYTENAINEAIGERKPLVEQRSRLTSQFVV